MVTFGDLRLPPDPGSDLPEQRRYWLVVTASDVSRQRLARLPWDYRPVYGLDPDEQPVADAVRASASIPFFFEPIMVRAAGRGGVSTLVDGGVLSNFPIALSARPDGRPPTQPVTGPVSLALAVVETMIEACDAVHIDDPCVQVRSIFVDTSGVSPVDFGITEEQQQTMLAAGRTAADAFLGVWDFAAYIASCRGGAG